MVEKFIREIELLKKKENLLIRLTNQLSSYFIWKNNGSIADCHIDTIEKILEEYYELLNEENDGK